MSDILIGEIAESYMQLEIASVEAMERARCRPDEFVRFTHLEKDEFEPKEASKNANGTIDRISGVVSLYGGKTSNEYNGHEFGDIIAKVTIIPADAAQGTYNSGVTVDKKDEYISVTEDLISKPESIYDPVIVIGLGREKRRRDTRYRPSINELTVVSGRLITNGTGWTEDRTIESLAVGIPNEILLPRLLRLVKSLRATTAMFGRIQSPEDVIFPTIPKDTGKTYLGKRWQI